jgi:hypothetical protein
VPSRKMEAPSPRTPDPGWGNQSSSDGEATRTRHPNIQIRDAPSETHKYECADCGGVKTKILFRKQVVAA